MAREDKRLTAFDLQNTKNNQETVKENSNIDTEQKDVSMLSNSNTETKDVTLQESKALGKEILQSYEEKKKAKTVEETHTRVTFLCRNDLAARLDKVSRGKRGFKTMALNKAIENLLDELEKS